MDAKNAAQKQVAEQRKVEAAKRNEQAKRDALLRSMDDMVSRLVGNAESSLMLLGKLVND